MTSPPPTTPKLDALIFGGGAAGLWTLDTLRRQGFAAALVETGNLGGGQTIVSQGIIHGGTKYSLGGRATEAAERISEMPALWRACLTGDREPHLANTPVRSQFCFLWRTASLRSRVGMLGARLGLQVTPRTVTPDQIPAVLRDLPEVRRLDEPVLDVVAMMADLARRNAPQLLAADSDGIELAPRSDNHQVTIRRAGRDLTLHARTLILTAGAGNAALRRQLGLPTSAMQRRPLHMAMVRGALPPLSGHCVDGARTRVTITWSDTANGERVWLLGGQVAEDGIMMEPPELVRHAQHEISETVPGLSLSGLAWSTYRVDRAEQATPDGRRPSDAGLLVDDTVISAWPTKLALVPVLADRIVRRLEQPAAEHAAALPTDWPRPAVAPPPWEVADQWFTDS